MIWRAKVAWQLINCSCWNCLMTSCHTYEFTHEPFQPPGTASTLRARMRHAFPILFTIKSAPRIRAYIRPHLCQVQFAHAITQTPHQPKLYTCGVHTMCYRVHDCLRGGSPIMLCYRHTVYGSPIMTHTSDESARLQANLLETNTLS